VIRSCDPFDDNKILKAAWDDPDEEDRAGTGGWMDRLRGRKEEKGILARLEQLSSRVFNDSHPDIFSNKPVALRPSALDTANACR
jgi:hypothetical protein